MRPEWDWIVTGFNSRGKCLSATKHSSQISVLMEVQAWVARIACADDPAAFVEVVDLRNGSTRTFRHSNEVNQWQP
jgi:hypothetical protein